MKASSSAQRIGKRDQMSISASRDGPQSVGRILGILDLLADRHGGATLTELAAAVGAPKTSLVGLLAGLVGADCVQRNEAGRYTLGPRMHALAVRTLAGRELAALLKPTMQALVNETGETVALGAVAPDAEVALYLAKVESTNPIRYAVTVGERRDLYCTAIGKALLAHFDEERLARYLKEYPRQQYTPTTLTSEADLRKELARIRKSGVAVTNEERFPGASGFAAPIFSGSGEVIAALLVAGPSHRMRAHAKDLQANLKRAALECSRIAGGLISPVGSR